MTIDFQFRGMPDGWPVRRRMTADLEDLRALAPVISAHVGMERQPEASPPYQAMAALVVGGLGFRAAARDHDWLAAWEKVVTRLRQQILARRSQRTGPDGPAPPNRSRSEPQARRRSGRPPGAATSRNAGGVSPEF